MKRTTYLLVLALASLTVSAQSFQFDFTSSKRTKEGYVKVTPADSYTSEVGYGYDLIDAPTEGGVPFFFSVAVPDGNYRVTVVVGSKQQAGMTTLRGESRRLFYEHVATRKGELVECSFVVNKRNVMIGGNERVRIKPREMGKLNWDNKLTLEINGEQPVISEIRIERTDAVPTLFLFGDSTVVDQDNEPWASWGQMVTRFFTDALCVANYAESGERTDTFIAAGRLRKALTQMKAGDYVVIEFGHNDEKLHGAGKGAWYSYATCLKTFIDEVREKGATPILVTPTQRRHYDENGTLKQTHGEFPAAMKWVAEKEGVALIDLTAMTTALYNALGVEGSKGALVHYPANSFAGQTEPLADNTHFNPYGAYQVAKCVIEGMKQAGLPLTNYLRSDYLSYDPTQPDDPTAFRWDISPFVELEKPDGN